MIDINAIVDMSKDLDISMEEVCYLNILHKRDITSLFKYVFFAPETIEGKESKVRHRKIEEIGKPIRIGATTYVQGDRAKRAIGSDMIDNLLTKGYIKPYAVQNAPLFDPTNYEITQTIEKYFLFNTDECIEQLVEVYPKSIMINGKQIPLLLLDHDLMGEVYAKSINHSLKKHKEILSLISNNSDNINFKLENFIRGRMWKDLSVNTPKVEKVEAI